MPHAIPDPNHLSTRRQLLQSAGAVMAGAAIAPVLSAQPKRDEPPSTRPSIMRIGILMGTLSRPTLEARLDAIKRLGIDCAQLSMDCAGLSPMPDAIAPELTARIRRESADRGISIVSLQGTFNMSHPDAEHRRTGLRRLGVLAEACRASGPSIIHLCTGTRDRANMWRRHPDNDSPEAWRDMAACLREAADIARKAEVVLAFEPEVNNVVDSAKKSRRLMDEIGSAHLKVCIDGANLFHTGELARMRDVLEETFERIGKDIVLAHAKDLDHDGDAGHLPAGKGKLDYDRYLSLLHSTGFRGPLLLHGLNEAQVPGCVEFLRQKIARLA